MTDERAKEIADEIRAAIARGGAPDTLNFAWLLHLYDELQALKAQQAGLSFMSAGIKPVVKVEQ